MNATAVSRRVVCAAAVCLTLAVGSPASAQYFGRNKVHYKELDFQILQTEHFDIYFYPAERQGIDVAARLAERWHTRLERLLEHQLRGRQPLVLYASHPDFEQTNTIAGELGEGTGGVTEPVRRRIVLPLAGPLADTDHVIGHELVHAFQFDITTGPNAPPGQTGAGRLPLWFIEGMAEYLTLGPIDPNTAMWLRDAARREKLPAIDDLDSPQYFPYRWGQAFWAYVGGRFGDDVIRRMLSAAAEAGDPGVAIEKVLGVKTKQLSEDWQTAIRRAYEPILRSTTPPSETARVVIKATDLGAEVNVGPAISPDGRRIAFLSERSVFSTDLFIADASTGKIVRKLTSTATDPHYSSIQFIYSAGGWDASGKRIAIATVTSGRPAFAIFDAESGDKQQEVEIPELDELFNPTWAPDGHALAFTGMSRGLTDLYVYDLKTSKLRPLTNDAYAELMPAWSPDGRRIAFATDRFSSDLRTLHIGSYRIALIDPESGAIEQLRAFTSGKNINPQWSPDGLALYFISDRDGIPNLYRTTLASGDVVQLTKVGTGLSGITNSSPTLSVAARTGTVCFSVYENGRYSIYTLDPSAPSAPLTDASAAAATLPPVDRRPGDVASLLANATLGLPAPTTYPTAEYKPTLSLEGVAQPTIGVGADRFGAAIGGGIAFQFGDLLGNHLLVTGLQLSVFTSETSFKDTAAQVAYLNQARRWNWGLIAGQAPYRNGGFRIGVAATPQGDLVQTEETIIRRQTEQGASAVVAYPFNRAQRIEFQGGVSRVSFDQITRTTQFSLITRALLAEGTETVSVAQPLTLATSSAALVYDTSNFGATSPVQGQRYRFEGAPALGSINFTSLLADYRRYFMPVSFYTIAARAMHYGRYGSGGQDQRLFPLFIGYPNLVRGYDVGTFDGNECVPTAASTCPAFDRLLGSRVLIANLEFRFPLLRPFGASRRMYGPVPVEVAFFADGGVAWNGGEKPSLLGGSRDGVASAGTALRVNLFGYLIGEFAFSRPFQRPGKGLVFQFNLSPGF